jgi:hypothetical protein
MASVSLKDGRSSPKHSATLNALQTLKNEVHQVLTPVLLDENTSVEERRRFLWHYVDRLKRKVMMPIYQGEQQNPSTAAVDTKETVANQRIFAVHQVDGAFAITYTPVRVPRRKDQTVLGSKHVITPVKRSMRGLIAMAKDEGAGSSVQVKGLREMFDSTGYVYAPNSAL